MKSIRRMLVASLLAAGLLLPISASARPAVPGPCVPGDLKSGAKSLISVPTAGWNRELVLHTTRDEVIPFWRELLYLPNVDLPARGRFLPIPAFRYGHCNFTRREVLTAFGLAVQQP